MADQTEIRAFRVRMPGNGEVGYGGRLPSRPAFNEASARKFIISDAVELGLNPAEYSLIEAPGPYVRVPEEVVPAIMGC
ncbi:MAG: hypothetical protein Q8Q65_02170 [bacterium]|nr:hypothetical protein [bacterium]